MKKHYKFVFKLETPLPVSFTYRETANAFPAALRRAAARFRIDTAKRPIRNATIVMTMLDNIEGLKGRPDVEGGEPELGHDDDAPTTERKPRAVAKVVKHEEPDDELEEDEDEELDDEEEEDEDDDVEEEVPASAAVEEAAEDDGVDAETLLKMIESATSEEEVAKLKLKYIDEYEWEAEDLKAFDKAIGTVRASWAKEEKPKSKKKGSAFDQIMSMKG